MNVREYKLAQTPRLTPVIQRGSKDKVKITSETTHSYWVETTVNRFNDEILVLKYDMVQTYKLLNSCRCFLTKSMHHHSQCKASDEQEKIWHSVIPKRLIEEKRVKIATSLFVCLWVFCVFFFCFCFFCCCFFFVVFFFVLFFFFVFFFFFVLFLLLFFGGRLQFLIQN